MLWFFSDWIWSASRVSVPLRVILQPRGYSTLTVGIGAQKAREKKKQQRSWHMLR